MPAFAVFNCHAQTALKITTSPIRAIRAAASGGMGASFNGDAGYTL
jgi:hypothetical protein